MTSTKDSTIALRLAKFFGTSAKFWLGLQNDFDIEEEKVNIKKDLELIETLNYKRDRTMAMMIFWLSPKTSHSLGRYAALK